MSTLSSVLRARGAAHTLLIAALLLAVAVSSGPAAARTDEFSRPAAVAAQSVDPAQPCPARIDPGDGSLLESNASGDPSQLCAVQSQPSAEAASEINTIDTTLCDNGNVAGVQNNARNPTRCTLDAPTLVTLVRTYHWNNGRGVAPGTIGLRAQDGTLYGPWQATGSPGQGGVPNAYWEAQPNVVLPAGTYTIVDSDPATWANNSGSNFSGMSTIQGQAGAGGAVPPPTQGSRGTPGVATPTAAQATRGVEGLVRNATTGQPIAGASISGGGRSTTAGADGRYQLSGLTAGAMEISATAPGFVEDRHTVTVPASGFATQVFALSPPLAAGQTRIVLTWGQSPSDLDSHLWLPSERRIVEIDYTSKGNLNGPPFANLDVDDTNSFGPETVTLGNVATGQCTYAVYNYSGSPALATSGARVVVYRGDAVVQSFTVPSGNGLWWHVFNFDCQSGTLNVVNRLTDSAPTPAAAPPAATQQPTGRSCEWTGTWVTEARLKSVSPISMQLVQTGSNVQGSYDYNTGQITARVEGNRLIGQWAEAPATQPGGDFEFTISPDCNYFEGRFQQTLTAAAPGSTGQNPWMGARIDNLASGGPGASCNWSGAWDVPGPWGRMSLIQSGGNLTGSYTWDQGRVLGAIVGGTFRGFWSQATSYSPPGDAGGMEVTIAGDCNRLEGRYRYGAAGDWQSMQGARAQQ
jgi:hypothetical protein